MSSQRETMVIVNDWAGHPFQIELSRALAPRGGHLDPVEEPTTNQKVSMSELVAPGNGAVPANRARSLPDADES